MGRRLIQDHNKSRSRQLYARCWRILLLTTIGWLGYEALCNRPKIDSIYDLTYYNSYEDLYEMDYEAC
jgi:hypothetical protein